MTPAVRHEFVLFGDSITQQSFMPRGWGAHLANKYSRTADILLRGYSGYNTRWILQLLPFLFPAERTAPALVTILLGANDACRPPPLRDQHASASRQHVPLEEYQANLKLIVKAIGSCGDGSARVLLVTPPPVDHSAWHTACVHKYGVLSTAEPNRLFSVTENYAVACMQVAKELGLPAVDLVQAFQQRDDWHELLSDGLHPNGNGGDLIFALVDEAIKIHFPELIPGDFMDQQPNLLPMDFPDHKALDANTPEESFVRESKRTAEGREWQSMPRRQGQKRAHTTEGAP